MLAANRTLAGRKDHDLPLLGVDRFAA